MEKSIRKEFFAYRNGVVADALRHAGDPHQLILGCQLADIISIAGRYEKSVELAQALWGDASHRECRLAAPMLYPVEEFTMETAITWCQSVESYEVADVLCHRLLRHLDYASQLCEKLRKNEQQIVRYTGYRLLLNLLMMNRIEKSAELHEIIEEELTSSQLPLQHLLKSILEELK
ncbi:MAG: DNA alkylation repair protein [Muribaculaceae bacterium]|nr:DNA alkylation repair protein [Muribaculaceae bacterium]